jgi:5'-3' exonuclease
MTILIVDGHNFLHRARSGFQLGPHCVTFNFFRNLRALVERFKPTRLYFSLEGKPKTNLKLLPEYKANRKIEEDTPEFEKMKDFWRQKDLIVDLLSRHFPVSIVHHPDFEADDTIYNLIERSSTAVPWVVVSNDSDFTQLLNEFTHVQVYNPMKKEFFECPDFDYVVWKSLRGDCSDNIPGIPGIGDEKATAIVNDQTALYDLLQVKENADIFTRNHALIAFQRWSDEERILMTSSMPTKDWNVVATKFAEWDFKSLLKEKTWMKFNETIDSMWG